MQDGYDVMQVCLNGHQITASAASFPLHRKPFCPDCGAETIMTCPLCNTPIQGHLSGVLSVHESPVPHYCHQCGSAYPWRQAAIANVIEIAQLELDDTDAAAVPALVHEIAIDMPRTEISALKLKRILSKLGKPTYDVAIKVISDIASEAAKKALGLKPP